MHLKLIARLQGLVHFIIIWKFAATVMSLYWYFHVHSFGLCYSLHIHTLIPKVHVYYKFCSSTSMFWFQIVMEYCGAGSVSDIMRLRKKTLSEEEIATVLVDTLRGLEYLHLRRKIHRDIKAGNILLNTQGHAKLADFGVAGQLSVSVGLIYYSHEVRYSVSGNFFEL